MEEMLGILLRLLVEEMLGILLRLLEIILNLVVIDI